MNTSTEIQLKAELKSVLTEIGYQKFTPIQEQSIPLLLSKQDFIGKSKTGSGKTAAFCLPILQHLELNLKMPQTLILCPTRELAQQVTQEMRKLGRRLEGLQVLLLAGGVPAREQAFQLRKGVHITVGTPGRVLDLIYKGELVLEALTSVVLDEADKMLELGFEPDINAILDHCPEKKQTVLFSATFPENIKNLTKRYLHKPNEVSIEDSEENLSTIELMAYEYPTPEDRFSILIRILLQHPEESILIFCNQRTVVDEIVSQLQAKNISCLGLHGLHEQQDREKTLTLFKNQSLRVLVATDVAARGIDIENLALVINYDFPLNEETFIHRIGRTGRNGASGKAITLIKDFEEKTLLDYAAQKKLNLIKPSLGFKGQFGFPEGHLQAKNQTLLISAGRKNKLRPGDILGALTGPEVNLEASAIGKIDIKDFVSYVAIQRSLALSTWNKLKEARIKAQRFSVRLL